MEEVEEQEEQGEKVEEEDQHCDTKARLQQNQSMRYVLGSYLPQLLQSVHETLFSFIYTLS